MLDPLDAVIKKLSETPSDISLKNIKFKDSAEFTSLLDAMSKCLTLETIAIDNCIFSNPNKSISMLEALLETLAKHPTISWLLFTNNKIGDSGASLMANKLSERGKFSALTGLNLENNSITEANATFLCAAITHCPTLTKFTIDAKFSKINEEIEKNLDVNKKRITKFQINAENTDTVDYKEMLKSRKIEGNIG